MRYYLLCERAGPQPSSNEDETRACSINALLCDVSNCACCGEVQPYTVASINLSHPDTSRRVLVKVDKKKPIHFYVRLHLRIPVELVSPGHYANMRCGAVAHRYSCVMLCQQIRVLFLAVVVVERYGAIDFGARRRMNGRFSELCKCLFIRTHGGAPSRCT